MRLSLNSHTRFSGSCHVKITRKITIPVVVFLLFTVIASWQKKTTPFNEKIDDYLTVKLRVTKMKIKDLQKLAVDRADPEQLKKQFRTARFAYKKLAILTEYFNPYESKILNGPAIPRIESGIADRIIPPQGFQAAEQLLLGDWNNKTGHEELSVLTEEMLRRLTAIENETDRKYKFSKELVFDAIRASIVAIITTGITGFDSPVANYSLPEAVSTLEAINNLLPYFSEEAGSGKKNVFAALTPLTGKAINYLRQHNDFNGFDRLAFIADYLNPIYKRLVQQRVPAGVSVPPGRNAVNFNAESIFEATALSINFYSPPSEYWVTPERVKLGKRLFSDPILSGTKTRSCASCHKPEKAFTDGLPKPYSLDGERLLIRNTPTLYYSGLQTKQFFDSRADILENQLSEVVHNTEEMQGSMLQSAERIKNIPLYTTLFWEAYPAEKETINPFTIANSISSYVRSLQPFNSAFDHYMRGDKKHLTASAKRGFNLFTGKAKCATCHFIPLFNGVVPPAYAETESEVLGVPESKEKNPAILDADPGKYLFTKSDIHKYSFKTPTLRNVELTAPYMHNGVYTTLEEVMEFYNKGGGRGLKIAPPNQTLPFEKLNLTPKEIKDVISFMKALTDTSHTR